MEEHNDHTGSADIETLRYMHQRAAVVVGLVLPVHSAAIGAVAATPILVDVQEWLLLDRIVAEVGECRIFQTNQRGLIFSLRTLVWRRRRQRGDPVRRELCLCSASQTCVGPLPLLKALTRRWKAIHELRSRESVVEAVACRGMRI